MKLMKGSKCNLCGTVLTDEFKIESTYHSPLRVLCMKCVNKIEGVEKEVKPELKVKLDELKRLQEEERERLKQTVEKEVMSDGKEPQVAFAKDEEPKVEVKEDDRKENKE